MPANRKPKAWNLKPQLTAAPELWQNCTAAWAFWEGVGGSMDLVSKTIGSPFEANGAWAFNNFGYVFDATAQGGFCTGLFGRDIFTENNNTIIIYFSDFSEFTESITNVIIAARDGWSSGTLIQWGWLTNENRWVNNHPAASSQVDDNPGEIQSGPQVVTFRNDGTLFSVRRNGKNIGSAADPGFNSSALANRPVTIGAKKDGTSWDEYSLMKNSFIFVFSTVLSDSDVGKIERDPFVMLRPAGF